MFFSRRDGEDAGDLPAAAPPRLLRTPRLLRLSGLLRLPRPLPVELLLRRPDLGPPTRPGLRRPAGPVPQPPPGGGLRRAASKPPGRVARGQRRRALVPLRGGRDRTDAEGPGVRVLGPRPAAAVCGEEPAPGAPPG